MQIASNNLRRFLFYANDQQYILLYTPMDEPLKLFRQYSLFFLSFYSIKFDIGAQVNSETANKNIIKNFITSILLYNLNTKHL